MQESLPGTTFLLSCHVFSICCRGSSSQVTAGSGLGHGELNKGDQDFPNRNSRFKRQGRTPFPITLAQVPRRKAKVSGIEKLAPGSK